MEKISVIVPVFNVEKYLVRCVDSILKQTYQNLEIILVDDGSTDSCPAICDRYKDDYGMIKVIHKTNGGLSSARNVGLDMAEGDFVLFVDSDDFIEEEMLEKLHDALVLHDADMSVCNIRYVDEQGKQMKLHPSHIVENCSMDQEHYWRNLFVSYANGVVYIIACNKLYRKKLWDKLRFPEGKLNEDEFVVHNIVRQCGKIAGSDYVGYDYVQRTGSIVHQLNKKANFDKFEALEMRINYFASTARYDFARKQLSLFFDVFCFQYMQCRTMQEKEIFREKLQKYSAYLNEFYRECPAPTKERMNALGGRCAPWLFCRMMYVYRCIGEKLWNLRHWEKW
jgi:glycosyltransferase involved in cell wall biosynthesis